MAQICAMILPVVAYGDPVLRKEATEVTKGMEGLEKLIESMWETMYRAEGVGLAAPQVGRSIRMFVVDGSPFGEGEEGDEGVQRLQKGHDQSGHFSTKSEEECDMEEGCLSIPGVREPVTRPVSMKVEYFDAQWVLREEALSGIAARIVLHENDHLDGVDDTRLCAPLCARPCFRVNSKTSPKGKFLQTIPCVTLRKAPVDAV